MPLRRQPIFIDDLSSFSFHAEIEGVAIEYTGGRILFSPGHYFPSRCTVFNMPPGRWQGMQNFTY